MTQSESPAFPANPWSATFLIVAVIGGVVACTVVFARHSTFDPQAAVIALLAALLAVLAWNRFGTARLGQMAESARPSSQVISYGLLAVSFGLAAFGLSQQSGAGMEWSVTIIPYLLILVYQAGIANRRTALLWVAPMLFGFLFLATGALLGNLAIGGFPAALAALLTFIVHATHELELRTEVPEADSDPHVHLLHRRTLAWISIVFFLFGVISFWPWLGKMYGDAYFWVMAIGVLTPLLYLWGRLRQPRRQNSYVALLRFNRLIPYVALVLLVAIALG
jgi:hypothetical protein